MLALITHLDGANAQLFHVEHCGNRKWRYQIRWPSSTVRDYREWQPECAASGDKSTEPLMDPTVIAEVRWRWEDGDEWQSAVPHEWESVSAGFRVILKQPRDFRKDPVLHAAALVRDIPVAFELVMPARYALPGEFTVTGTAMVKGPGTVLRQERDFFCENAAFTIWNVGVSQVALRRVPPAIPKSLPFLGIVGVRVGMLTDHEISLLRETAGRESEVSHG